MPRASGLGFLEGWPRAALEGLRWVAPGLQRVGKDQPQGAEQGRESHPVLSDTRWYVRRGRRYGLPRGAHG